MRDVEIDEVIEKLLTLELTQKTNVSDSELKKGLYPRDFGIEIWDWPQGVGLYGLHRCKKFQENPKYNDFISKWFIRRFSEGLPLKNINTTAPMLTLLDYITNENNYLEFAVEWAEYLLNELPKTKEGCFQHVTSNVEGNGVILNDSEIWIDTLFMAILFLNKLGLKIGNDVYVDEAYYQILQHIKYLFNPIDKLFYHGYSFNKNSNFGQVYWCRGNSWFTYGMVDFLEMNENKNSCLNRYIRQVYMNQVDRLITLQSEEGLWHTVLDDPSSYIESSGSAAILAGIFKGIRLGILDKKTYLAPCLIGIEALMEKIDDEGIVMSVSGGTGIGEDVEHYKNIIKTPIAYGQSLAIIALNEYYLYLESEM